MPRISSTVTISAQLTSVTTPWSPASGLGSAWSTTVDDARHQAALVRVGIERGVVDAVAIRVAARRFADGVIAFVVVVLVGATCVVAVGRVRRCRCRRRRRHCGASVPDLRRNRRRSARSKPSVARHRRCRRRRCTRTSAPPLRRSSSSDVQSGSPPYTEVGLAVAVVVDAVGALRLARNRTPANRRRSLYRSRPSHRRRRCRCRRCTRPAGGCGWPQFGGSFHR